MDKGATFRRLGKRMCFSMQFRPPTSSRQTLFAGSGRHMSDSSARGMPGASSGWSPTIITSPLVGFGRRKHQRAAEGSTLEAST